MPVDAQVVYEERSSLGYNCVRYARTQTDLPQGLWTLKDKTKHIRTIHPEQGLVAVTNEGKGGHLSIVVEVEPETIIVRESNYRRGYITLRRLSKNKILGYY